LTVIVAVIRASSPAGGFDVADRPDRVPSMITSAPSRSPSDPSGGSVSLISAVRREQIADPPGHRHRQHHDQHGQQDNTARPGVVGEPEL
jgi:hypothetical protein